MTAHDEGDPVRNYLATIGKRGGEVTGVKKGFAAGNNAQKAVAARRAKAAKKAAKKATRPRKAKS